MTAPRRIHLEPRARTALSRPDRHVTTRRADDHGTPCVPRCEGCRRTPDDCRCSGNEDE